MAASPVAGYNIGLSINGKTILGKTQDDLNISAQTKESITKDDKGNKNVSVTGHDVTFSVSAILLLGESASSTTNLDADAVIDLALKTGTSAVIPFTYARGEGKKLTGNCIITGYTESSFADPSNDSTISLNCQTTGAVTLGSK